LDPDGKMTKMLSSKINDSGKAYMTFAVIQDRGLIRWVIGQTYVEERHVVDTWNFIKGIVSLHWATPNAS